MPLCSPSAITSKAGGSVSHYGGFKNSHATIIMTLHETRMKELAFLLFLK
jgi:hypothetical protein